MVDTARTLSNAIEDKTIVFTGAMIPVRFGRSDGLFNKGSAFSFVQVLPPKIYCYERSDFKTLRKIKKLGVFEELELIK